MIEALVAAAMAIGAGFGYALAILRTDRLLAKMTPDELKALAARVKYRKGVS